MTTDEEQDLLRAMLVLAAAGLDGLFLWFLTETNGLKRRSKSL
jgi:hypothetical protein